MNISKDLLINALECLERGNKETKKELLKMVEKEKENKDKVKAMKEYIKKLEKENVKIDNAIENLINLKKKQVSKSMEYRKRTGKHGDEKIRAIKRFNNNKDLQVVIINNMTFKREDLIK